MVVGKERFTVLDALAGAGDLTEYGKRDNVLVIRTENGKSTYHRLNLTDGEHLCVAILLPPAKRCGVCGA
ncbi:MAG: hypothetical protein L6U16_05705 [Porphyromonadaceae bacterium]|nr:MAG: hypothetical protein L6U16_05705 [Porphyromonadaceae bacterium]